MSLRRLKLLFFLLMVHLHVYAGELLKITDLASLKPAIAVTISDVQASQLKANGFIVASNILGLYLIINDSPATTSVAGTYHLNGKTLSFSPAYPLGENMEFEVQYRQNAAIVASQRFRTPSGNALATPTKVVTAYPLSDTIPYNTLFFHVRFSQEMRQDREAYKHIKVFDETGMERTRVWRQRSFWLDNGKLLVLMIHPGRVKNGIHHDGPLFDSGKHYTLVVDKAIEDVNGNAIEKEYMQQYFVAGEDRALPKASIDRTKLPAANTANALTLSFSEGMDHASVIDGASLLNSKNEPVACRIEAISDDKYRVISLHNWKKEKYTLVLKSAVYDFAANRIGRPFEIKNAEEVEKDKLVTTIEFEVK